MRVIDVDELLKRIRHDYENCGSPKECGKGVNFAIVRILCQDIVELVRCKDCKWSAHDFLGHCILCQHKNTSGKEVEKNHFCSYGERREDER